MNNAIAIREIADIQVGYQARASVVEDPRGQFTLVRAQDFDQAGNLVGPMLNFAPGPNVEKYVVSEGDILLLARGKTHHAYLINASVQRNIVASSTFYIIRSKTNDVISSYLAWWLNQTTAQAYFKQHRGTSTLQFISMTAVESCPIVLPPIRNQQKITNLLNLAKKERILMIELARHKETIIREVCRKAVLA